MVLTRLRPWVEVARPSNFFFVAVPLLVGTALAVRIGHFSWPRFLGLAGIGVGVQLAIRYLNDPADHRRGIDRPGRLRRYHALSQGLHLRTVEVAGLASLGVALLLCVWLALVVDVRLLLLTALMAFCAVTYAGGPWPYSSHALGEVAQFVWFGVIATVCVMYVLSNTVDVATWLAGIALGFTNTTFMVANNTRDVETDKMAGKLTVPQLLGRTRTDALFASLVLGAYVVLPAMALADSNPYVLVAALSLPLAIAVIRRFVRTSEAVDFQPLFPELSRLNLVYGALLAAGLLLPHLAR